MRRRLTCTLGLFALVLVGACERVIDLNLTEGDRKLVVEARLERVLSRASNLQTIKLSTTGDYFSGAAPPPATGATVTVTSNLGVVSTFMESAVPGTYSTSALTPARGRTYTLRISYAGQQYEATEATMPVAPIMTLTFRSPVAGRYSGRGGVRATIQFTDRPGERNYYMWDEYVNGVRQLGPDSSVKLHILANDDGYDGLTVKDFQPFEGIDIPARAVVLVRQYALSESIYRYFFALNDQLGTNGSPFSVPPASLRGNVSNLTNRTRPAAGYFLVSEVSEVTATFCPVVGQSCP
jgi:hypothetical protein